MHVAVAHQDELRVDALGKERFGEGFVGFRHGRGTFPVDACRWHLCRRCKNWDLAFPAGGFRQTLHQACAQTKGGIVVFLPHEIPLLVLPRCGAHLQNAKPGMVAGH